MSKLRIPLSFKETDLHRSIYDLSQTKVTTMMQCLNYPIKFEIMKPKDEFTVDYASMIDSMPLEGRQLNDWKLRIMLFKSSLSNYYSWMDNNARINDAEIENRRHHTFSSYSILEDAVIGDRSMLDYVTRVLYGYQLGTTQLMGITNYSRMYYSILGSFPLAGSYPSAALDPVVVKPNSLLDMIEMPVGFFQSGVYLDENFTSGKQNFNADYLLCYLDAVRNYLVNNQLDTVPYFVNVPSYSFGEDGGVTGDPNGYVPRILELSLSVIDKFFKGLRMQDNGVDIMKFACLYDGFESDERNQFVTWLCSLRYGGLFLAQYEKDMLNGLLRKVSSDDVNITVSEDGTFSINDFRLANRKQLFKDRFGISGGRWKNLLRSIWGSEIKQNIDIPELINVSSYYVSAKSLMSNANTYDPETGNGSSVGQLNGVFSTNDLKERKIKIYSEDHSIMFAVVSLVPDVVYCDGLGKGLDIIDFDDEYYPQFDQIGFEDVPFYKYSAVPYRDENDNIDLSLSNSQFNTVVGKTIAFIDLISNVNRCHGKFTKDQYFEPWVLKRRFEDVNVLTAQIGDPIIAVTTYANPLAFQYPFTVQSADDPNFVFQIKFDIRAVRSKGKYYMPTLGK